MSDIQTVASVVALNEERKKKSTAPKTLWRRAQAQLDGRYSYAEVMESSSLAAKRLELLKIPEPKPSLEDFIPNNGVKPTMPAQKAKAILSKAEFELKLELIGFESREEHRLKEIKNTEELIVDLSETEREAKLDAQAELWPQDVVLTDEILAIEGITSQVEAVNETLDDGFRELANYLSANMRFAPGRSDGSRRSRPVKRDPAYDPEKRLESVLGTMPLPLGYYAKIEVGYLAASQQALVEFQLPDIKLIPTLKAYKYTRNINRISEIHRSAAQTKVIYAELIAQVTLLAIEFAFAADHERQIETLVFNGYVKAIDPRSGHPSEPCLVSVRVTRDQFEKINLQQVEPQACLRHLSASVSRSPGELSPVRPILDFEMFDPRFVEAADAITNLDSRPNLMDLTPTEFEGLIQNLFEKMGLEARQTQASRDGGVDCIAYDSRPVFGGKVVIQAKRYKNTVGVSAVRDLFGTLQNEGASKGILVTTSGYGSASFEFAQNKPIELLEGSHLLYLLKEYAGINARIEAPEGWRDPTPDSGEDY